MRDLCISMLAPRAGERILDIGCGPAYYLDRLPDVQYWGFDTEPRYIEYARRRWGRGAASRARSSRTSTLASCPKWMACESQGVVSRLMSYGDRGRYVRPGHAFEDLARAHFGRVESRLAADVCRVPGAYWAMRPADPRPAA